MSPARKTGATGRATALDASPTAALAALRRQYGRLCRTSPSLVEEHASLERKIAAEYEGRWLSEMLQNADDACGAVERAGTVSIRLGERELLVANDGQPFEQADVASLVSLGVSTKRVRSGRRATIGFKGLGFKSILSLSREPEVVSGPWAFRFEPGRARSEVQAMTGVEPGRVAVMRLPFELTTIHERCAALLASGATTVFRFPLLSEASQKAAEHEMAGFDSRCLLFLPHLRQVELISPRQTRTFEAHRVPLGELGEQVELSENGLIVGRYLLLARRDLVIGDHRGGLDDDWDGVDLTEVTVAIALDPDDQPIPEPVSGAFFVHLPIADAMPLPFLVHGAFRCDLGRRSIPCRQDPLDYNRFLLDAAAGCAVDGLIRFLDSTPPAQRAQSVARLLVRRALVSAGPGRELATALDARLKPQRIWPVVSGEFLPASEVIIARSWPDGDRELLADLQRLTPRAGVLDAIAATHVTVAALSRLGARKESAATMLRAAVAGASASNHAGRLLPDALLDVVFRLYLSAVETDEEQGLCDAARELALIPGQSAGEPRVCASDYDVFVGGPEGLDIANLPGVVQLRSSHVGNVSLRLRGRSVRDVLEVLFGAKPWSACGLASIVIARARQSSSASLLKQAWLSLGQLWATGEISNRAGDSALAEQLADFPVPLRSGGVAPLRDAYLGQEWDSRGDDIEALAASLGTTGLPLVALPGELGRQGSVTWARANVLPLLRLGGASSTIRPQVDLRRLVPNRSTALSAAGAETLLRHVFRAWAGWSEAERVAAIAALESMPCLPTTLGLVRPRDGFLNENLRTPEALFLSQFVPFLEPALHRALVDIDPRPLRAIGLRPWEAATVGIDPLLDIFERMALAIEPLLDAGELDTTTLASVQHAYFQLCRMLATTTSRSTVANHARRRGLKLLARKVNRIVLVPYSEILLCGSKAEAARLRQCFRVATFLLEGGEVSSAAAEALGLRRSSDLVRHHIDVREPLEPPGDLLAEALRQRLQQALPAILCRLELESPTTLLSDARRLEAFHASLKIVGGIEMRLEMLGQVNPGMIPLDCWAEPGGGWLALSRGEDPFGGGLANLAKLLCLSLGSPLLEPMLLLLQASTLDERLGLLDLAGASTDVDSRAVLMNLIAQPQPARELASLVVLRPQDAWDIAPSTALSARVARHGVPPAAIASTSVSLTPRSEPVAVEAAVKLYQEQGYRVTNVSRPSWRWGTGTAVARVKSILQKLGLDVAHPGCDLVAVREDDHEDVRLVEVKGLLDSPAQVTLTANEWRTATSRLTRDLFDLVVVSSLRHAAATAAIYQALYLSAGVRVNIEMGKLQAISMCAVAAPL
jgi:hypothetical protein